MEEGYSICLNKWALDCDIKNELGLLLIISSLCAEKGYCYATNEYLSELFGTTEVSISRKISKLASKKYISIEYERRGCEIKSRKLRLTKMLTDDYQNCYSTINKNVKEKNINKENNNNINIIIPKEKIKKFTKPTKNEIEDYCKESNLEINAEYFIDYYESKGWLVGKTPMKNWKSAVRNWCRNNYRYSNNKQVSNQSTAQFEWVTKDGETYLERVKK